MPSRNSNAHPRSAQAGRGPAPGPRRESAYELFVLGELSAGPHHGYLLRDILGKILGPFRQVSWGALYPLIHRLSRDGLIAPVAPKPAGRAGRAGQGHARILYRITPAGRQRFRALMLEQSSYAAYDTDVFVSKLGYFDHIDSQQQVQILTYPLDYLTAESEHIRSSLRQAQAQVEIPPAER